MVLVAKAGLDLYGRTLGAVLLPTATVAAAGRPVPLDSLLVVRGWAWAYDPHRAVAGRAAQQAAAQRAGLPRRGLPVALRGPSGGAAQAVALVRRAKQAALPGRLPLVIAPRN